MFFLLVGIIVRRVREPAIQRLAGVVWFLSVARVAWAVGLTTHEVYGNNNAGHGPSRGAGCHLVLGGPVAGPPARAAELRPVRGPGRHHLGIVGIIVTVAGGAGSARWLAFALALWVFGLAWAWLGWRRYVEPMWVTIPCGVILALIAPSFAVGDHGWMYAIGIATAVAVMAASVPLRNTPLLALGTLAMFGYVTSAAVRYFRESLGVPAALAITGVLIISLAVVSARLMRATHPPKPKQPGAEKPTHVTLPPKPTQPGTEKPSHQDLPRDLSEAS